MEGLYDIHCHIVPGVDDGAADLREALHLLKLEYGQGVRTIIATPHFRAGMFETPPETVARRFMSLVKAAEQEGIDVRLYLGCEFHSGMEMAQQLKNGRGRTMAGSRYVLTEFSHRDDRRYIRDRVYSLLSNGYRPIIAHVERYPCMRKDVSFIRELTEMGAYIQVNADSIIGGNGFSVKLFCRKLMKNGLLHFVGSDAHGPEYRRPRMKEAYSYMAEKMGRRYADTVFIKNPRKIIK